MEALGEIDLLKSALVLITADHGGKDKGHGGASMGEIEIPWIIGGSSIVAGHTIMSHVNTFDTAATIAYAFGLTTPDAWIARPVTEAFNR